MQTKFQRGQQMSLDAFDALIARQSPLDDAAALHRLLHRVRF
jgi:hypothetical protein